MRLAFAAAALAFGAGVIAYVFLWMFMPVGDPVAAAQAMSDAASTGFAEPLSRGNAAYAGTAGDSGRSDATTPRRDWRRLCAAPRNLHWWHWPVWCSSP